MSENTKVMIVIIIGVGLLGIVLFKPDILTEMLDKLGGLLTII